MGFHHSVRLVGAGARIVQEGVPPQSPSEWVATLDDPELISGWLGTFRERLRIAKRAGLDSADIAAVAMTLEGRLRQRRVELS